MVTKIFCIFGAVVVGICVALMNGPSSAASNTSMKWSPPQGGVIRDGKTAISIARLIWFSGNPKLKPSSDQTWQNGMTATLEKGVWHVAEKPLPPGSLGGGLEIDLSQKDGRVLGIYLTQ